MLLLGVGLSYADIYIFINPIKCLLPQKDYLFVSSLNCEGKLRCEIRAFKNKAGEPGNTSSQGQIKNIFCCS